ncbi:diguanylate cyclase [Neobacillus pocheonensis]|uniref:diguanylate cyclase domain-containing protein n=1 Tax=Neobacillus pocheonensis TaxID=363869 RepID=UPI003D2C3ED2
MNNHSQNDKNIENLQLRIKELEEREAELIKQLRLNSSLHSMVLDALPINIYLEDSEGKTIFANKQACEMNGMKLEELIGKTVFDFFPKNIAKMNRDIDLEVWRRRSMVTNELMAGFQGKEFHMFSGKTIIEVPDSNEEFLLGFGLDITELKKAEEKIAHMAYHDALTGLPNRWFVKSFLEKFQTGNKNNEEMAGVILLDLDHFKIINDSLGHQAGDILLKAVAQRLSDCICGEDILARFGGDEFVLLLPNLESMEKVYEVSKFILKVMKEPFTICGQKFTISPSIGISLYPQHGEDINDLIKHSDLAMYHSKRNGRNCYSLYNSKMDIKLCSMKDHEKIETLCK